MLRGGYSLHPPTSNPHQMVSTGQFSAGSTNWPNVQQFSQPFQYSGVPSYTQLGTAQEQSSQQWNPVGSLNLSQNPMTQPSGYGQMPPSQMYPSSSQQTQNTQPTQATPLPALPPSQPRASSSKSKRTAPTQARKSTSVAIQKKQPVIESVSEDSPIEEPAAPESTKKAKRPASAVGRSKAGGSRTVGRGASRGRRGRSAGYLSVQQEPQNEPMDIGDEPPTMTVSDSLAFSPASSVFRCVISKPKQLQQQLDTALAKIQINVDETSKTTAGLTTLDENLQKLREVMEQQLHEVKVEVNEAQTEISRILEEKMTELETNVIQVQTELKQYFEERMGYLENDIKETVEAKLMELQADVKRTVETKVTELGNELKQSIDALGILINSRKNAIVEDVPLVTQPEGSTDPEDSAGTQDSRVPDSTESQGSAASTDSYYVDVTTITSDSPPPHHRKQIDSLDDF